MQIILHLTKNLSQPQDKGREKQNFKNIQKTNKISTYKNRRESSLNYFTQETKDEFHLQKRKKRKRDGGRKIPQTKKSLQTNQK